MLIINIFYPIYFRVSKAGNTYTAENLIWIQYLERRDHLLTGWPFWLMKSLIVPVPLLLLVKVTSPIFGRQLWWIDVATALFGICSATLTSSVVLSFNCKKKVAKPELSDKMTS